jgi:Beta-glucosidase-related glycosidases
MCYYIFEKAMRKQLLSVLLICAAMTSCVQTKETEMDRFIDDLMSNMTIEEKLGQLNLPASDGGDIVTGQTQSTDLGIKIKQGLVGGVFNIKGVEKIREVQRIAVEESRLKIPLLFGMDVIHGYETIFPIPIGMSCTWNMEAVERSARIAAIEASADGISWTFSPMVDISRDPRWGRVSEGNGEDPFLAGKIAKAMVYGYQGVGESLYSTNSHIMACVKHYALYGASEAGRDYNTVDMSRLRMFNEYMYPYQAAVDAGVGSVMAAFNEVDGIPATGNKWLMTDILRDKWGFDGFVVTDYTGTIEMVDHGIGDFATVSAQALAAGIDMDMVSEGVFTLKESMEAGLVTEAQINQACRRILEAKYVLGLFDDPYKYCDENRANTEIYTDEHRAEARSIATESFVLLKNDKVLPLERKGTIAVVGPLANTRSNMVGTWSVAARLDKPATLIEGLAEVAGDRAKIVYAKGSNLTADETLEMHATMFGRELGRDNRTEEELRNEALRIARGADIIVAALGESSEFSGEASSRTDIGIPDVQKRLLVELVKTGKPVVLVLFTGRPLTLEWENENVPAILNVWFGGSESAHAIGDVLFGDANPSGKLTHTFPRNVGQIPLFYNHKNTGRPLADGAWFSKFRSNYIDVPNTPLYPFGYGLSYTTFEYSDVTLSSDKMNYNGDLTASVTVTNTGKYDGAEVVQLYIRDLVGSITRPVKELKGFDKVMIKAGESKTVDFKITPELLKFYNYDLEFVVELGEFDVMIGGSSDDVRTARFEFK